MNNVNLIGRITKDFEIKMTKADTPMVTFTLACKRRLSNKQGEKLTDFFNCVAFGSKAEFLAEYACKSTLIGIEGRLQSKVYVDEYDKRHSTVDIICEAVQILRMPHGATANVNKAVDTDIKNEEDDFVNLVNIEEEKDVSDEDKSFDEVMSNFSTFFED